MSFIARLSIYYSFSKTKQHNKNAVLIILGLAVALVALILVIGVMNGLQNNQLRQLRNLSSFDLIIEGKDLNQNQITGIKAIDKAYEFCTLNAMIAQRSQSVTLRLRAFKDNSYYDDPRVAEDLAFAYRSQGDLFALSQNTIYRTLQLNMGEKLSITILKSGNQVALVPFTTQVVLNSSFISSSPDFNSSMAFIDWSILRNLTDTSTMTFGIFLSNSNQQSKVVDTLRHLYPEARITTWQEANSIIYSAMMLEKAITFIFLLFILLIIALSLKKSTARLIEAKKRETAILLSYGLSQRSCILVYVLSGAFISFIGISLGTVLSLILSSNMSYVFSFIDTLIMLFTKKSSIFSYYDFTILLKTNEVVNSILVVFFSSVLFTALGARKALKPSVMEVLNE